MTLPTATAFRAVYGGHFPAVLAKAMILYFPTMGLSYLLFLLAAGYIQMLLYRRGNCYIGLRIY